MVVPIQKHHAVLGHDVEETPKTQFDLIQIFENVGVIELNVVHDQQFRQVMNEL